MSSQHRHFGLTSTRDRASRTPTPKKRFSNFNISLDESVSPTRWSLDRVTVFMRIGRLSKLWTLRGGGYSPNASNFYASERGFTSTRFALLIHLQYYGHPAPGTENTEPRG